MAAEMPLSPAFSRSTAISTTGRAASIESSVSTTESVVSKIDVIWAARASRAAASGP